MANWLILQATLEQSTYFAMACYHASTYLKTQAHKSNVQRILLKLSWMSLTFTKVRQTSLTVPGRPRILADRAAAMGSSLLISRSSSRLEWLSIGSLAVNHGGRYSIFLLTSIFSLTLISVERH